VICDKLGFVELNLEHILQMPEYTRISFEEREKIYLLQKQGLNVTSIAKELDRHKSNISRELKRCKEDPLGYIPDRSHAVYRAGLLRNKALFCAFVKIAFERSVNFSIFIIYLPLLLLYRWVLAREYSSNALLTNFILLD
jgi:hypothetical protein